MMMMDPHLGSIQAGWLEDATNPPSHCFPSVAVEIMFLVPSLLLVLKPQPSLIQSTHTSPMFLSLFSTLATLTIQYEEQQKG